jgi:hypothetical protein
MKNIKDPETPIEDLSIDVPIDFEVIQPAQLRSVAAN